MGLMLHCGTRLQNEATIRSYEPEAKSKTHEPLGHGELIDMTRLCLREHGIEAGEGTYGASPCGEDMFGVIELPVGIHLPAMEARNEVLAMEMTEREAAHALLQAGENDLVPARMTPCVWSEYKHAEDEGQREAFQQSRDGNRLLQAFTSVNQRHPTRKDATDFNVVNAMADRSSDFTGFLLGYMDPGGLLRSEWTRAHQLTFIAPQKDTSSRYVVGLRNSNRMRFPAGFLLGEAPFICDNLAFCGEAVDMRKHTKNIREDLKEQIMGHLNCLLHGVQKPENN